jgi:type VI secretion system secreted protein Hcp
LENSGTDCVLKFENFIVGESEDPDPDIKGGVALRSFAWGATTSRSSSGTGRGAAAAFKDLNCTADVSKASPQLFLACVQNQRIRSAKLFVRKQGALDDADKSQGKYYVVTLKDVAVTSYTSAIELSSNSPIPADEFTLSFAEIDITFQPQTAKGGLGPPVSGSHRLVAGSGKLP